MVALVSCLQSGIWAAFESSVCSDKHQDVVSSEPQFFHPLFLATG